MTTVLNTLFKSATSYILHCRYHYKGSLTKRKTRNKWLNQLQIKKAFLF